MRFTKTLCLVSSSVITGAWRLTFFRIRNVRYAFGVRNMESLLGITVSHKGSVCRFIENGAFSARAIWLRCFVSTTELPWFDPLLPLKCRCSRISFDPSQLIFRSFSYAHSMVQYLLLSLYSRTRFQQCWCRCELDSVFRTMIYQLSDRRAW